MNLVCLYLLSSSSAYSVCLLCLTLLQKEDNNTFLIYLFWKLFVQSLPPSMRIPSFYYKVALSMWFLSTSAKQIKIWISSTAILSSLQPVAVSRQDPDSRKSTVTEITSRALSRGQWPQVINILLLFCNIFTHTVHHSVRQCLAE